MLLRPRIHQSKPIKATTTIDSFPDADRGYILDSDPDTLNTKPIRPKFWSNYFGSTKLREEQDKGYGQLYPTPPPDGPFLLISIDFCGPLKRTPRENQYVLIITDYFTCHITAIALPNCMVETAAQALMNEYFCIYGIPSTVISDQGSHFQNQLMKYIQKLIGYHHFFNTPYHPQTNGIVECFNSTFIPQISKLQYCEDNNWDEYLEAVVFAYNSGTQKTIKYSPCGLLYGRSHRLPIHTQSSYFSFSEPNDYFTQLQKTNRYDQSRLDPHYNIGDKVVTHIYTVTGKLDSICSPMPKMIISTNHSSYIIKDTRAGLQSQVHAPNLRLICIA
ncbi:unnamed protein product [Rotaria sp. Silwood1]|nr:unnamed protein product [Rotaria sp. Silwood1]CAF5020969.1 unnamed protein product [Rotaria sp. Silwood1]